MGVESLTFGHCDDGRGKILESSGSEFLDRELSHEAFRADSSEGACPAARRERVVSARCVVSGAFGGLVPDEYASGRADLFKHRVRVLDRQDEVLGGVVVRDGGHPFPVILTREYHRSALGQGPFYG